MPIYFGSRLIKEARVGTQLYDGYVGSQMVHGKSYEANFEDNSWEQIISACKSGNVPETWVVGNQKAMTIGGNSYLIDIIGKNHDTYTRGGTAPLTFQMHDLYGTTYPMNSTNTNKDGYGGSLMHTTHLPAIKALMPSEVQAAIKPVNKLCGLGYGASSGVETVSCDLFLLSEIEIFGSTTMSVSGEGMQYAYYVAGNSKVKNRSGSASKWWERSPLSSNRANFCCVSDSGKASNSIADYRKGVAFGFCF